MDLYKLMLVDDEEEVRTSIIRQVNWENLGFRVVGDAENGEDALEKIDLYEPDVVMTDIRMPYMDGLELIQCAHSKHPALKFVIFSGFDDFEYAQEAIRLGVSEYILKPVNNEELSEIFAKIKKNLDAEIEIRRDIARLREHYLVNLPLLKSQFLNHLVNGQLSTAEIGLRLEEYGIDIAGAKKYMSACVDIEYDKMPVDAKLGLQKELLSLSLIDLIGDKLGEYHRCSVFNSLTDAKILLIIALDEKQSRARLMDILRAICKESKRLLGITISMGLGMARERMEDLAESYQGALEALGYKQIVGQGELIYIQDVEPRTAGVLYFDDREDEELSAVIKFGPEERIRSFVDKTMEKLLHAKVHLRQQQAYILSMVSVIIRLMQQYDMDLQHFDEAGGDFMLLADKLKNPEILESWFYDICLKIHLNIQEKRENTSKQVIVDAKAYIQENYRDESLTVEVICRQLHMSAAYFSTLFKKETGQTCIAYITELRLNKAVELLNTTDYKTYMIASMVGYAEQNYFSYVFKKKYGVSPSKYRNLTEK